MSIANAIDLIVATDDQVRKVRSQGKDFSFNELLAMYEDGELIIKPEYQRLFRWSEEKESRFIESLILELPLPPIFVIEIEEGKYELIDGLQRISSYFHFRGKLVAEHRGIGVSDALELSGCDIVPQLNGYNYSLLPRALEVKLKRHTIRVEVIRRESDSRLRYHMFKRLNSGGVDASPQEIRNCTIRLLDNTFNDFIAKCSTREDFATCISPMASEKIDRKEDQELVLRFFALKNNRHRYVHEIGEFLTDYMESVASGTEGFRLDYQLEEQTFLRTFRILRRAMEHQAFAQVVARKDGERLYPFSVLHFEAFSLGVQDSIDRLDPEDDSTMLRLKECCWEIKRDKEFIRISTGGGKNSRSALAERVRFVSERIGKLA